MMLTAAEGDLPYPEIEDPFGLGQRLALIDHLREEMEITPPDGADLQQLLALYWKEQGEDALAIARGETPPSVLAERRAATALRRERLRRMRQELQKQHGVDAPDDADEERLRELLAAARKRVREESLARAGATDERSGAADTRQEPAAQAVAETEWEERSRTTVERPDDASDDPLAGWRHDVLSSWKRFADDSEPWDARWSGDVLPADGKLWRVERDDGSIDLLDEPPTSPEGIRRYWWPRIAHGRASTPYVWSPADWNPQKNEWLSVPIEHHRFGVCSSRWRLVMNSILAHPELTDSPAQDWLKLHKAQLRAALTGQDQSAAAEAVATALTSADTALGTDLRASQRLAVQRFLAISAWNRCEAQIPALRTGNTASSTPEQRQQWLERVQAVQAVLADQRALLTPMIEQLVQEH